MAKLLTIIPIVFLMFGCNRYLLTEPALKSKTECREVAEGLTHPKDVYSLFLHMPDTVTRKILAFKRLNELDINRPKFNKLPGFIARFKNLQTLIITESEHLELTPAIGKLKNLKWLRLWNLNLTTLPPEIEKLKKLEKLELFANNLSVLPGGITKMTHLQKIGIDANYGLDFYDTFEKLAELPNLTYLNLNYYPHDTLPGNIGKLRHIETITLWNNENGLLNLDDMLEKLSTLKRITKIDLSGTPVKDNLKEEYVAKLKKQCKSCEIIW